MQAKTILIPRDNSNVRDIGIGIVLTELEWLESYDYRHPKIQKRMQAAIWSEIQDEIAAQKQIHNIDGEPMRDDGVQKAIADLQGCPLHNVSQSVRLSLL